MKILIVDDEPDILETTAAVLEVMGHESVAIARWEEAVPLLESQHFDVVLQDMRMPGLNIVDHIQKMRLAATIRVVLFTANRVLDADAASMDIDGLLPKPFDAQSLVDAINATDSL